MTDDTKNTDETRRDFIKGAGVVAAGAGLVAATGGAALAQGTGTSGAVAKPLAGKTALVTGAARAIGRAIAIKLAQHGADVALLDIASPDGIPNLGYKLASQSDLEEAVALTKQTGQNAFPIVGDIRNMAILRTAVAQVQEQFGKPLDIAVANAGIVPRAELKDMTDDQWQHTIDVNLGGTANTIRAVMPGMMQRKSGRIITIGSTVGRHGSAGNSHYVASKWGMIGLTKSAAMEAGESGVTVNTVNPTAVDSVRKPTGEALKNAEDFLAGSYNVMDVAFLKPEAIADSVAFLASESAAFITGETLDVAAGANARYTA